MEDCVFCKIIKGKLPAKIEWQDEEVVAFEDINPRAPVHFLIVPRKHLASLQEASNKEKKLLGKMLLVAKKIAQKKGIAKSGYRIGINCGRGAGQVVFHLHFHLLGGWEESLKDDEEI